MNIPSSKRNIIKELIGKGSSALVYKIIDLINNKIYAVKESLSKEAEFLFKNEINIFSTFQNLNPYIIHFYNYKILPNKISLELEYCQYGSLRDLLKKAKKRRIHLTENEISAIIYMVLNGLNFMHEKNLINRDIKCKNILVNKDGLAKLCDFGISQIYQKDLYPKNKAGSPYWMSPELINMQKYNKSVDIWSLGITCIELAEYEPPYINYDKSEALEKIKKNPPKGLSFPKKWSYEFNNFVRLCLNVNKYQRPNCQELLEHDFMGEKEDCENKFLVIGELVALVYCESIQNQLITEIYPSIERIKIALSDCKISTIAIDIVEMTEKNKLEECVDMFENIILTKNKKLYSSVFTGIQCLVFMKENYNQDVSFEKFFSSIKYLDIEYSKTLWIHLTPLLRQPFFATEEAQRYIALSINKCIDIYENLADQGERYYLDGLYNCVEALHQYCKSVKETGKGETNELKRCVEKAMKIKNYEIANIWSYR